MATLASSKSGRWQPKSLAEKMKAELDKAEKRVAKKRAELENDERQLEKTRKAVEELEAED